MGAKRNAYRLLVGKSEAKRSLGRQDVGGWIILGWILERSDGVNWIGLAKDRNRWRAVVNSVLNLRVP
jgi:hypothetical protein